MGLFNRFNKEKLDYEFECTSGIDFVLKLDMVIKNNIFNLIFSQLTNHGNLISTENKGEFEILEKYYNLIHSTAKDTYSEIKETLLKENKIMLNYGDLKRATLQKQGKDWLFKIRIEGNYNDTT